MISEFFCWPFQKHYFAQCWEWDLLLLYRTFCVPSVLWRCWLSGRKGIRSVKNWVVRCWHGYLSGARCRLAYAQLMPLPLTVSCFSKIQIGFTFLVPTHPGSPGKRAVKRVSVCACACVCRTFWWSNSLMVDFLPSLPTLVSQLTYQCLGQLLSVYTNMLWHIALNFLSVGQLISCGTETA